MCSIKIENFDIGEEHLRQVFEPYGPIKLLKMCRDPTTGVSNFGACDLIALYILFHRTTMALHLLNMKCRKRHR